MSKHIGSSFDDFLKEDGIYEEAHSIAIKRVLAWQIAQGHEPLRAIRVGMAVASLNATMLLPGRIDPAEVLALAETIAVEQV